MTAKCTAQLLANPGVTQSLGRPRVSNDNPYSEVQFKTIKYHPGFPSRFGCIEDAKDFCRTFFQWYNTEHRHGGISLLTPQQVYFGRARGDREQTAGAGHGLRRQTRRFVKGPPKAAKLLAEAWINRAIPVTSANGAKPANGGKESSLN
ncbi:MAG: integrase core domain-containing protein [Gemmatimonadetes bacterium]|nr:integrase core domain-containing protein [Gemmatimonadota bacterium]